MTLIEYPDRDLMMIDLANLLAGELNACLMTHDRAAFAVPGGTTPGPMFDALCAADIDWDRVTVLPTDERWVAADDPRSNAGLIRGRLLQDRAASAAYMGFHPTGAPDSETPEDGAARVSARMPPHLPVSVLLLGMGEDMHTASLFPNAHGLDRALGDHADPVVALHPEGQPEARVSLSGQVLQGAMSTHLLVTGAAKRAALEAARRIDDPTLAPVSLVLRNATVHWSE